MNRHLHINTGSHGTVDGSTVYWMSEKAKQEKLNDRKAKTKWNKDADKFMNQDLDLVKLLGQQNIPFSVTTINETTPPVYPSHCDVIDTWCFS
jgi:N-acetylmuramoyl-L-alanine amidase